jgi:hypothetical protein
MGVPIIVEAANGLGCQSLLRRPENLGTVEVATDYVCCAAPTHVPLCVSTPCTRHKSQRAEVRVIESGAEIILFTLREVQPGRSAEQTRRSFPTQTSLAAIFRGACPEDSRQRDSGSRQNPLRRTCCCNYNSEGSAVSNSETAALTIWRARLCLIARLLHLQFRGLGCV